MYAYVGCRTTKERNARGRGISVYEVNGQKMGDADQWKLVRILEGEVNPSFLCINRNQDRLYSIHGDFSEVSAYAIGDGGMIEKMVTRGTHGTNPVHLLLSGSEKWLYVANLQTGSVSVMPVLEDGSLGKIEELYFISGDGGPGHISHPHQICLDRTGKWMLVPAQGRLQGVGKVTSFRIDEENGTLQEASFLKARTGGEPRNCVFHPNNRFLYFLNEKDSTMWFCLFDEKTGVMDPQQILTTLPETYPGDGWASGLIMSEDGKTLYASNRKHDSITVFSVDQESGRMTYLQNIKTGGGQPRFITFTPDEKSVIAANETTDTLTFFDIQNDGTLSAAGMLSSESPVCIAFSMRK